MIGQDQGLETGKSYRKGHEFYHNHPLQLAGSGVYSTHYEISLVHADFAKILT